jgi:hypothetical protein
MDAGTRDERRDLVVSANQARLAFTADRRASGVPTSEQHGSPW